MRQLPPVVVDNLTKLAKQFYGIASNQLFEQRDPHSPIVNAFYEWVRKLNGIINPFDVMEQNELQASIFIFLFEHNLLFQLIVLGRFDLIQILWREGKLSDQDLFFLNSMLEELIRNNQYYFVAARNFKMLQPDNLQGLMHLMNASSSVLNFYLYCALDEEYKRQVFKYHVEHAALYEKGLDKYINLTSKIMNDSTLSDKTRKDAQILHEELQDAKKELSKLKDKKLLYPNNKPNLDAAKKYSIKAQEVFQKWDKKVAVLTDSHTDARKYGAEAVGIKKGTQEAVQAHHKQYEVIFKNFEVRLSQLRQDVTADKGKIIEELIKTLWSQIYPYLNKEQQTRLNGNITVLKNLRLELANVTDPTAIKQILGQCTKPLQEIIAITQTIPQLGSETTLVKKIHETFAELAKHQVSEQAYAFADKVNSVPINIKAELQTIKEEHHSTETEDIAHAQESEVIKISEEFCEKLKEEIPNLENSLEEMKMQEPDEDINSIIIELEDIINQFKSDDYLQIKTTAANKLLENMVKLNKIYSENSPLDNVITTFKTLAHGLEYATPTPRT